MTALVSHVQAVRPLPAQQAVRAATCLEMLLLRISAIFAWCYSLYPGATGETAKPACVMSTPTQPENLVDLPIEVGRCTDDSLRR